MQSETTEQQTWTTTVKLSFDDTKIPSQNLKTSILHHMEDLQSSIRTVL